MNMHSQTHYLHEKLYAPVSENGCFLPVGDGATHHCEEDIATLKKLLRYEKKRRKAVAHKIKELGVSNKKTQNAIRQYLRSKDVLTACIFKATIRLPLSRRVPLTTILEKAKGTQILKGITEEFKVSVKKKSSGKGVRVLADFGLIARGAQIACYNVIRLQTTRQPFQFPGKGHVDLVALALDLIQQEGFTHVAELDISNHYGSFEPQKLKSCLTIPPGAVNHVLLASTGSPVFPSGKTTPMLLASIPPGIPQGGLASNAVAAWSVSHLDADFGPDIRLINYADNFFLFGKTAAAVEHARSTLSEAVAKLPGGTFHLHGGEIVECAVGFKMLGYDIWFGGEWNCTQTDNKHLDFMVAFSEQSDRVERLFEASTNSKFAHIRTTALHEFRALISMAKNWFDKQKICNLLLLGLGDPEGVVEQILYIAETFNVTNEELKRASDPFSLHYHQLSISELAIYG